MKQSERNEDGIIAGASLVAVLSAVFEIVIGRTSGIHYVRHLPWISIDDACCRLLILDLAELFAGQGYGRKPTNRPDRVPHYLGRIMRCDPSSLEPKSISAGSWHAVNLINEMLAELQTSRNRIRAAMKRKGNVHLENPSHHADPSEIERARAAWRNGRMAKFAAHLRLGGYLCEECGGGAGISRSIEGDAEQTGDRVIRASHEAAHVVVAITFGIPIDFVTVSDLHSDTQIRARQWKAENAGKPLDDEFICRALVQSIAGLAGETLVVGDTIGADSLLAASAELELADYCTRRLIGPVNCDKSTADRLFAEVKSDAEAFIQKHLDASHLHVTKLLMVSDRVEGDELVAALAEIGEVDAARAAWDAKKMGEDLAMRLRKIVAG